MSFPQVPNPAGRTAVWRHVLALATRTGRVYGPYKVCDVCGTGLVLVTSEPLPDAPNNTTKEAV